MKRVFSLVLVLCMLIGITSAFAESLTKASVTGITLSEKSVKYTLVTGYTGTMKLTATVSTSDGSSQKVTWSSSNESVASVKANGNNVTVTLKKKGSAKITAAAQDGSGKKAVCKVKVTTVNGSDYYKKYLKTNMDSINTRLGSLLDSLDELKTAFQRAKNDCEKLADATDKLPRLKDDKKLNKYLTAMKKNIEEGAKRAEQVSSSDSKIMKYQQNAVKNLKSYMERAKKLLGVD